MGGLELVVVVLAAFISAAGTILVFYKAPEQKGVPASELSLALALAALVWLVASAATAWFSVEHWSEWVLGRVQAQLIVDGPADEALRPLGGVVSLGILLAMPALVSLVSHVALRVTKRKLIAALGASIIAMAGIAIVIPFLAAMLATAASALNPFEAVELDAAMLLKQVARMVSGSAALFTALVLATTAATKSGRSLFYGLAVAPFVIAVCGAWMTPPDLLTMIFAAIPLALLWVTAAVSAFSVAHSRL